MTIIQALKTLFGLSGNPKTIAEALDEAEMAAGLPEVTAADNGKILKVVNGTWAAVNP